MFKDLVKKSRSIRRFRGDKEITKQQLHELVDLGRMSPSAANLQPLKYILVNSPKMNEKVFNTLAWAGYLKEWDGPDINERPTGYIIMLRNKNGKTSIDEGIAAQSIFLGAAEMGLGGCFIGSIKKKELSKVLDLEENLEIALVIALGYPSEAVVLEDVEDGGSIKYWRDENQVHHVPKRILKDLIIKEL